MEIGEWLCVDKHAWKKLVWQKAAEQPMEPFSCPALVSHSPSWPTFFLQWPGHHSKHLPALLAVLHLLKAVVELTNYLDTRYFTYVIFLSIVFNR